LEKRLEFRAHSDLSRWRVVKLADICRGCALHEVEELRGTDENQGELWSGSEAVQRAAAAAKRWKKVKPQSREGSGLHT